MTPEERVAHRLRETTCGECFFFRKDAGPVFKPGTGWCVFGERDTQPDRKCLLPQKSGPRPMNDPKRIAHILMGHTCKHCAAYVTLSRPEESGHCLHKVRLVPAKDPICLCFEPSPKIRTPNHE